MNDSLASGRPRRAVLMAVAGSCVVSARPTLGLKPDSTSQAQASSAQPNSDQPRFDDLLPQIPRVFELAASQFRSMLGQIKSSALLPRSFVNGALKLVYSKDWTSGFFPGSLWYLYEHTSDPHWKLAARNYMHRIESVKYFRGDHDIGFMLNCSFGNAYRLTNDRSYRKVLIHAARSLATRFNPQVGMIRSWDFGTWQYPVIIDNLMNLELLMRAARESGEARLREIAIQHADNTLKHHFRADSSSVHLVDFDPRNGAVLKKQTVQGAADGSAWARGQAWGLYGYTMMFRESRKPAYLAQAQKIARLVMRHPRLPADKIPYWDFDAPDIPNTYRDTSAAAITASALLELSDFSDPVIGIECRQFGRALLLSLTTPDYLAKAGENGGFLLMHAVGNRPNNVEVDVPLNFADYYLLEALLRYQRLAGRS